MTNDNTRWDDFVNRIEKKTVSKKYETPIPARKKDNKDNTTYTSNNEILSESISMADLLERRELSDLSDIKNELPPLSHGSVNDIDRQTANRFLKGKMPIDATLDLHGFRQEEALEKLQIFIGHAYHKGYRNILIITGKGRKTQDDSGLREPIVEGILKERVPQWLNQSNMRTLILAFTYAQQEDGGTGALYVLMKRNRGR